MDTSESDSDDDMGDGEILVIFNSAMQSELDDLRSLPQGCAIDAVLKVLPQLLHIFTFPSTALSLSIADSHFFHSLVNLKFCCPRSERTQARTG
jgi:hypothetical protein